MAQQQRPARSVGARGGHEGPVGVQPGPHPTSESALYATRTQRWRPTPGPWTPTLPMDAKSAPTGSLENREERGFPQRPQPASSSPSITRKRSDAGLERTDGCREYVTFRRPLTCAGYVGGTPRFCSLKAHSNSVYLSRVRKPLWLPSPVDPRRGGVGRLGRVSAPAEFFRGTGRRLGRSGSISGLPGVDRSAVLWFVIRRPAVVFSPVPACRRAGPACSWCVRRSRWRDALWRRPRRAGVRGC